MGYQLVTTTYLPGRANVAAEAAAAAAAAATGLAGYWLPEIGILNQTIELWSQPRPAPGGEPGLDQTSCTMNAIVGPTAPAAGGGFYEFRDYQLRPGVSAEWIGIFTEALPARERHSRIVALFAGDGADANRVLHLWNYPDLNARTAARAAAMKDPVWLGFLGKSRAGQMVARQEISIVLPAKHSPLA